MCRVTCRGLLRSSRLWCTAGFLLYAPLFFLRARSAAATTPHDRISNTNTSSNTLYRLSAILTLIVVIVTLTLHHKRRLLPTLHRLSAIVDSMLCQICMDARIDVLLLPCMHVLYCEGCLATVTHCPMCRTHIRGKLTCKLHD